MSKPVLSQWRMMKSDSAIYADFDNAPQVNALRRVQMPTLTRFPSHCYLPFLGCQRLLRGMQIGNLYVSSRCNAVNPPARATASRHSPPRLQLKRIATGQRPPRHPHHATAAERARRRYGSRECLRGLTKPRGMATKRPGPARVFWVWPHETMYAPEPHDSSLPSAARNSMRVEATREPRRMTSARNSKNSPMPGRR